MRLYMHGVQDTIERSVLEIASLLNISYSLLGVAEAI